MKKLVRYVLLLVGPLLILAGVIHARSSSVSQAHDPVQAAEKFVPFSAETQIVTETGAIIVGRFYRRSDGSTRSETGKALDAPSTIFINNYGSRSSYMWTKGSWIAYPIGHPVVPRPWHPDEKSLARMLPVQESVDGLALLRKNNPGSPEGGYELVAPRLNFYAVVVRTCSDTPAPEDKCLTNRKFNIQIGEPPSELFEPGEGEAVAKSSTPFGPQPRREPK
jgi:hypothetical protein